MKTTMMLKCRCENSWADSKFGKGKRPHHKMMQEDGSVLWMCSLCYWFRTKSEGMRDGEKKIPRVKR